MSLLDRAFLNDDPQRCPSVHANSLTRCEFETGHAGMHRGVGAWSQSVYEWDDRLPVVIPSSRTEREDEPCIPFT